MRISTKPKCVHCTKTKQQRKIYFVLYIENSSVYMLVSKKVSSFLLCFCLFVKILYLFLERERKRGRETLIWEISISCLFYTPKLGTDQTHCNPGMCPERESDWCPFTLQDDAQSTEPHGSGLIFSSLRKLFNSYEKMHIFQFLLLGSSFALYI